MSKKRELHSEPSDSEFLDQLDPLDEEWEDNDDVQSVSSKSKRGRPRIQEQWSRVINLSKDDLSALRVFDLAPDLLLSNGMKHTLSRGKR